MTRNARYPKICLACGISFEGTVSSRRCPPCAKAYKKTYWQNYCRRHGREMRDPAQKGRYKPENWEKVIADIQGNIQRQLKGWLAGGINAEKMRGLIPQAEQRQNEFLGGRA